MNPFEDSRFVALNREAALTVELLCNGVKTMRSSGAVGSKYLAFFSLSGDLERLSKLALIIDSGLQDNKFPTDAELRKKGHGLIELSSSVKSIVDERNLEKSQSEWILDEDISSAMLACLSEFAKGLRYYNLDSLVGAKAMSKHSGDPIKIWRKRVSEPVLATHYPDWRREKDKLKSKKLGEILDPVSMVMFHADDDKIIESQTEAFNYANEEKYLKKWVPYYLLRIIRAFARPVVDLSYKAYEHKAAYVPHMIDHFGPFLNDDNFFKNLI